MTHNQLKQQFEYKLGKYYGYPDCCIEWFVRERKFMAPLTEQQEAVHNSTGFIPCAKCASKVTADTLGILVAKRKSPEAFPNDDVVPHTRYLRRVILRNRKSGALSLQRMVVRKYLKWQHIGPWRFSEISKFLDYLQDEYDKMYAEDSA